MSFRACLILRIVKDKRGDRTRCTLNLKYRHWEITVNKSTKCNYITFWFLKYTVNSDTNEKLLYYNRKLFTFKNLYEVDTINVNIECK